MKKSRFLDLHPLANPRKVAALDALQAQYTSYLGVCVETMLNARRFTVPLREKQAFFPVCEGLSSQIVTSMLGRQLPEHGVPRVRLCLPEYGGPQWVSSSRLVSRRVAVSVSAVTPATRW